MSMEKPLDAEIESYLRALEEARKALARSITNWAELATKIVEKIEAQEYEEEVYHTETKELIGWVLNLKALESEMGMEISSAVFHPVHGRKILRGAGFVFSRGKGNRKVFISLIWFNRIKKTLFAMG